MKIKLLLYSIIIHIISIIIGFTIVMVGNKKCMTNACKNISAEITKRILAEANPCMDFYTFACGTSKSMLTEMTNKTTTYMMNLLDKPIVSSEPKSYTKGKLFFKQCLQEDSDLVIIENVKNMISQVGGFPTVDGDKWKESKWTYEKAIKLYTDVGLYTNMLINIEPCRNPFNGSTYILISKDPAFLYPADCGDNCKSFFHEMYVTTTVKLGANADTADKDAKELLQFELNLTNVTQNIIPVQSSALKDYVRSYSEFTKAFPFIDWNEYFKGKLARKPPISKMSKNFIIVPNVKYLSYLNSVFGKFPKRLLANYMLWYNLDFFDYVPGRKPGKIECLFRVTGFLSVMANSMILSMKHNSGYGAADKIVHNIKQQLDSSMVRSEWMDEHTKKEAEIKIKNLKIIIGYYQYLGDYHLVDKYYEDFSLGDNYLMSLFYSNKHNLFKTINQCYFGSFSDEQCKMNFFCNEVMMHKEGGPFYFAMDNSLIVPDHTLQPPFFDHRWPKYINYGRFGSAIGHEMTHGFDVRGSTTDKDGQSVYWWTDETFERYSKKATCVDEQYSNISFFNGEEVDYINGYVTEKENIADIGGLELSIAAYQKMASERYISELLLPELNYTKLQLFFISAAQYWCDRYEKKSEYSWAFYNNQFPPYPVRVTGVMQNSPSFSEAFGCKLGDKMNSPQKCGIW